MKIGSYTIEVLSDGKVWLDGGAMFGVVPKTLWSKTITVDEKNRIPLETNCLLVRGAGLIAIIETGLGDHFSAKQKDIYNLKFENRLLDNLASRQIAPEDVTLVVQSHLHFDHCGTLAQRAPDGGFTPTFVNAEIVVQKGEWEIANKPDHRSRPSYFPKEFYEAVASTGLLRLVEGDTDIAPDIAVRPISGHTKHHQNVEIGNSDERLVFAGDFIPTARHVNLAYSMGFDLFPLTTVLHKESFLPQAESEGWIIAFAHDPDTPFARIVSDGRKWTTEPVSG